MQKYSGLDLGQLPERLHISPLTFEFPFPSYYYHKKNFNIPDLHQTISKSKGKYAACIHLEITLAKFFSSQA